MPRLSFDNGIWTDPFTGAYRYQFSCYSINMGDNLKGNPFASLFPSLEKAQQFSQTQAHAAAIVEKQPIVSNEPVAVPLPKASDKEATVDDEDITDVDLEKLEVNNLLESVFLITLDKEVTGYGRRPCECVFLEDLHVSLKGQDWLDFDCLEQAVFERLMMPEPTDHVIRTTTGRPNPRELGIAGRDQPLRYLYECFKRSLSEIKSTNDGHIAMLQEVILMNSKTCMQHPEFFTRVEPAKHFLEIFLEEFSSSDAEAVCEYFERVSMAIDNESEEGSVFDCFWPVFDELRNKFLKDFTLSHSLLFRYIDVVTFFSRKAWLAEAFMKHIIPSNLTNGKAYEDSLLGLIIAKSCIAKNDAGPYEFFDEPSRTSQRDHDITEGNIWQALSMVQERVYQIIYNLLKASPQAKHDILSWLGNCMKANTGRAKIWSSQMPAIFGTMYASDGFYMNLCGILLKLCQPFSQPCSPKLLKIQPTYCRVVVPAGETRQRSIHMTDLSEETCMVPSEENERPNPDETYSFVTECYYLAHRCLNLGFHVCLEKFKNLNRTLHDIQNVWVEIRNQGAENTDPGRKLQQRMDKVMAAFLSLKAAMTDPQLLELSLNFHIASATWLCQLATNENLKEFLPITFPLSDNVPYHLKCIPEFLMDNTTEFMQFLRRFKDSIYEVAGEKLNHLMTLILVFMGSPERMKNPHLRAKMAEALEALLPPKEREYSMGIIGNFNREHIFHSHPHIQYLAQTLIHVFVSIETTGESVEFEQKFNYRRPMLQVLDYMWEIEIHQKAIRDLAALAEENIEAAEPPLFLRFINLLINDAIFLLDEALQHLSQVKEQQDEKDAGTWANLPDQERQEKEASFKQLGFLARIFNMMSNDTIQSLERITREVQSIFTTKIMVDRIAAMLNYFLLHLVGPKKKNLKVKDFDKYEFKPQELVSNISQIYINLGESEAFLQAIPSDGRSFSQGLFTQARRVLQRINKPGPMIMDFAELSEKLKGLANRQKVAEAAAEDAPEEFLDPIMGTLMNDPVSLPSSGMIVDRATIARHILSDQTDPFNRSPLSMDQVIANTELKDKIDKWISEHVADEGDDDDV
ncbi:unnamed protein product [Owenia fusiformis]|uniref:Ubiquitin conjugation factor E4 A n=1 Tax=Owenia fusiformis TaxID=6347 RepID=A0A8J1U9I0_OWEFU|nr:unnamed protein product [Owenia fusiformis]